MGVVRVLVVDDQEPFRNAMSAVVEATDGFEVVGAVASGEESVTASERAPSGPGPDGREPARHRRHRGDPDDPPAGRDAPVVVLLSTYDECEFDHQGSGAAAYVPKGVVRPGPPGRRVERRDRVGDVRELVVLSREVGAPGRTE